MYAVKFHLNTQEMLPFWPCSSVGAKNMRKRRYKHITVVLCKKGLEEAVNTRNMRPFKIFKKMATMQTV